MATTATASGTFEIGGDVEVTRPGYGAMRITGEDVLEYCQSEGIGFIPWFPLAEAAEAHDATPGQIALAWLLQHSDVMLPIPGTGSVDHLVENVAAAEIELTDEEIATLDEAADQS